MATITKLKSGHYRIRRTYQKQVYSLVLDYKPTKSQADKLLFAMIQNRPEKPTFRIRFDEAAERYISSKNAILSQSTITGYYSILRNIPESFRILRLDSIRREDIQILLNDYASSHSPKSVRNLSGFISAVMRSQIPTFTASATLPQKSRDTFYVPEEDDVRRILDFSKGSKYEIPLWLACLGLRRSEVCALCYSDLTDRTLSISKALVIDPHGKWVLKSTKTAFSTRSIILPHYVASLIHSQENQKNSERIYSGSPGQINEYLASVEEHLGIEHFSLHKLRHYFAASAREIMSDQYVEEAGGWRPGSQVMRKVYSYAQKKRSEAAKKDLADRMERILK